MKSALLLKIIFLLTLFPCFAQNVLTEDFMFAPADSLEKSGEWERSGINTEFNVKIIAPGLEYKDYIGSGRGNCIKISNEGNGDIVYRNFSSPITTGACYMSFMLRVDSLPETFTQGYCISFNPNTGGTNLNTALHIKRLSDSSFQLGVRKLSFVDYGSSIFYVHKTYVTVLKYTIITGSNNDSSSMYVFSTGVPQIEPNAPFAATIEGDDYTGQASVYINNNYAQDGLKGGDIKIDGIRVGTSWESSVLAPLTRLSDPQKDQHLTMDIYPNPVQNLTHIRYQLAMKGRVKIQLFNAAQVLYGVLYNGIQEAGTYELPFNAIQLPAGTYTFRLEWNGHSISKTIQLIR